MRWYLFRWVQSREGGRGIGGIDSSRHREKDLFERRIGSDGVYADAYLAASALMAATANIDQQIFLLYSGWGGAVPKRMGG